MKDNDLKRQLSKESKKREEILDDVLKDIASYSEQIAIQKENIEQSKIEEIKYKTTIKEQDGYIEIYKKKIEDLEIEKQKQEKEINSLRKKVLSYTTKLSSLQSILDLFIREYGIEQISSITKIEEEQLKKLIKES